MWCRSELLGRNIFIDCPLPSSVAFSEAFGAGATETNLTLSVVHKPPSTSEQQISFAGATGDDVVRVVQPASPPNAPLIIDGAEAGATASNSTWVSVSLQRVDGTVEDQLYAHGSLTIKHASTDKLVTDELEVSGTSVLAKVGIGIESPARQLHLHEKGTDEPAVFHMTTANSGATQNDGFTVSIDGPGKHVNLIQREDADLLVYTNSKKGSSSNGYNERVRIKADGKLGIGTKDPLEKLHVDGNLKVTGVLKHGVRATKSFRIDGSGCPESLYSNLKLGKLGGGSWGNWGAPVFVTVYGSHRGGYHCCTDCEHPASGSGSWGACERHVYKKWIIYTYGRLCQLDGHRVPRLQL